MKFEIFKDKAGKFRFRLKSANGAVILASEAYETKAGAKAGIDAVKINAVNENQFEKKDSTNGKFYFVLKANNNEVIGVSELYASRAGREGGIISIKQNAADAEIQELLEVFL